MRYGINNQSIVPVRSEPSDTSEQVTQLLYGDHFKVLDQRKKWSRIRIALDSYEGWIDNKQYKELPEDIYQELDKGIPVLSTDLLDYVEDHQKRLVSIPIGSTVGNAGCLEHSFGGNAVRGIQTRKYLIETALTYLNSPYLWGGKTPFGIDCSGFTQMVYRISGYHILRDASQQATQGEALSFIEESEPGDLAFFDNAEGKIIHVGIIMTDNYIIHAHGKVRIDRIDHTGIFNVDEHRYSHQLRVIKKIIS